MFYNRSRGEANLPKTNFSYARETKDRNEWIDEVGSRARVLSSIRKQIETANFM